MNVKAAVAFRSGEPLTIETVQRGTKAGEVLVEIKATGVCHRRLYPLGADQKVYSRRFWDTRVQALS